MELNISDLVARIDTVRAIDDQISSAKGSASVRKAAAISTVSDTDEGRKLTTNIAKLEAKLAEVRGQFDDMVDDILRQTQDTSKLDGLKVARAAAMEEIDALHKVMVAFKVDGIADVVL
ncbi:MAG: hypothetical protein ABR609_07840, partial [Acidimicrobiia bacterium]